MGKSFDVIFDLVIGKIMLTLFCREFQICGPVLLKYWIET